MSPSPIAHRTDLGRPRPRPANKAADVGHDGQFVLNKLGKGSAEKRGAQQTLIGDVSDLTLRV